MSFIRKITAAAVATGMAVTLAACSSTNSAGEGELQSIRVGVTTNSSAAPVYIAEAEGYFEEAGLDVQIETVTGGPEVVSRIMSGDLMFGHLALVPTLVSAAKGMPVQIVAEGDMAPAEGSESWIGVVVRGDSPIEGYEDLAGKKIAVASLGAAAELSIRKLLDETTGKPDSAQLLEVPYTSMGSALDTGNVDAIQLAEPYLSAAVADGYKVISYPYPEATPGAQVSTIITGAKATPELVKAFQSAIAKARAAAASDETLIRDAVATYTKIEGDALANMILPDFSESRSPEADQLVADSLLKYGFIAEPVSVEDILYKDQ